MEGKTMIRRTFAGLALAALMAAGSAQAADKFIIMQSTTSTQNSGLLDYLLPIFTTKTGIEVRVVAVGTGQAIKNAANGDGDVLFVHSKPDEEKFVAGGDSLQRHDVMYNDFVVIGPAADPAGVKGSSDVVAAFKKIAETKSPFASRGDDSGTNKAELKFWKDAGVDVSAVSGDWYRETGQGMGATLNAATAMGAYSLTDRATWISFKNRGDEVIVVEGDPKLFNQYGVIVVNPAKHANVKADLAQTFEDWVLSAEGQQAIAGYKIDGQQLFFPNGN
jgi:tungstate transport system substrate-binding protein